MTRISDLPCESTQMPFAKSLSSSIPGISIRCRRGATIGANATIVCGITIGRYSFIAAGAVVSSNVPDYALMMGVPARHKGWMSRHGHRLGEPDSLGIMLCPESGLRFKEIEQGVIRCIDVDEEAPLPSSLAIGSVPYDHLKVDR